MNIKWLSVKPWEKLVSNEALKRAIEVALVQDSPLLVYVSPENKKYTERAIIEAGIVNYMLSYKCPCGYLGHPNKQCICTPDDVLEYNSKPYPEDFDMSIESCDFMFKDILSEQKPESLESMLKRVNLAKDLLKEINKTNIDIKPDAISLLEHGYKRLGGLNVDKIIKTAVSIMCLDRMATIQAEHIAEAIQYRTL
jgi:predicted ATPase with chaperone activity